jgi:hypothetical protein
MRHIKTIVSAGLLAGLFDIADAFIFYGARGGKIMGIGQSIASGLLGQAAYDGGWKTFAIGLALHFAMAVVMALVFYMIAILVPVIKQMMTVAGLVYGLGLYLVMTYVVVPHSHFYPEAHPVFPPHMGPVFYNSLFAHMVLVGLTIALVLRGSLSSKSS